MLSNLDFEFITPQMPKIFDDGDTIGDTIRATQHDLAKIRAEIELKDAKQAKEKQTELKWRIATLVISIATLAISIVSLIISLLK